MNKHEIIINHVSDTGRVVAGGAVTAGTTFLAVDLVTATQIAGLAAAISTALYFFVQFLYVCYKWHKEMKQCSPPEK